MHDPQEKIENEEPEGFLAINAELVKLEAEEQGNSDRFLELIERLMTLDMSFHPVREAMGRGAKKPHTGSGEATTPNDRAQGQ